MRWIVKKGILVIASLTVSMQSNAADRLDVYGVNDHDAQKIIKNYSKDIAKINLAIQQETVNPSPSGQLSKNFEKNVSRKFVLEKEIAKKYGFLFVDFQTVVYYGKQQRYYTTIEIIDKQHPERMRFVNPMPTNQKVEKASVHEPDLIDAMTQYMQTGMNMVMQHQLIPSKSCPVYHCTIGFEHAKLKSYLPQFNAGVIKDKKLIIETLKHDNDPERRTAAAYLVGHFRDPHEIVSVLEPRLDDKDDGVRNGVMRVIAETIDKAKMTDINVMPFLSMLDSPYGSDRNKSLMVLLTAADNKSAKKIILKNGGERLIALLKLQQPVNHDPAYIILKKISGKDFGSTNVSAWKNWVDKSTKQKV